MHENPFAPPHEAAPTVSRPTQRADALVLLAFQLVGASACGAIAGPSAPPLLVGASAATVLWRAFAARERAPLIPVLTTTSVIAGALLLGLGVLRGDLVEGAALALSHPLCTWPAAALSHATRRVRYRHYGLGGPRLPISDPVQQMLGGGPELPEPPPDDGYEPSGENVLRQDD